MPRHRGFTLVELLVVLAIITLLLSILIPSLNQAREAARSVVCLTKLRGAHMVLHADYLPDNQYKFPYGINNAKPRYLAVIAEGANMASNEPARNPLACPSDREDPLPRRSDLIGGDWGSKLYHSYSGNLTVFRIKDATHDPPLLRLHEVSRPADTYELTDGFDRGQKTSAQSFFVQHRTGSNFVFVDGHAEWLDLGFPNGTKCGASSPPPRGYEPFPMNADVFPWLPK